MKEHCVVVAGCLSGFAEFADLALEYVPDFLGMYSTFVKDTLHARPYDLCVSAHEFVFAYQAPRGYGGIVSNVLRSCVDVAGSYADARTSPSESRHFERVPAACALPGPLGIGVAKGDVLALSQGLDSVPLVGGAVERAQQAALWGGAELDPPAIVLDESVPLGAEIDGWVEPVRDSEASWMPALAGRCLHRIRKDSFDRIAQRLHEDNRFFNAQREFYEEVVRPANIKQVLVLELERTAGSTKAVVRFDPDNYYRGVLDRAGQMELGLFAVSEVGVAELRVSSVTVQEWTFSEEVPRELGPRPMVLAVAAQSSKGETIPRPGGSLAYDWLREMRQFVSRLQEDSSSMILLWSRY